MPIVTSPGTRISGQPVTISGEAVFVSGTVNIISGVSITVASGTPVSLTSGAYINIGSGVGVTPGSGFVTVASGLYVFQAAATQSGLYVVISGQGVSINSGLGVVTQSGIGVLLQSGIIQTVSGQYSAQNLAQGFPVFALYQPVSPTLTSGQLSIPHIANPDSDLRVDIHQLDSSGLYIVISGQGVLTSISGNAVFISGTVALLSGGYVNVGSGVGVVTSISGQAVFVSGTVSLTSGGYVNVGSGVGVVTSISGQALFISGTVALTSGGYVNIGSGVGVQLNPAYISGQYVNNTASSPIYVQSGQYIQGPVTTSISGNAVFVSGIVDLKSGAFVNIGSGIGVITQSGVIINVQLTSGQYIIMSGQGVAIASGIAYQMSGANVIATVSVGSGLYIVMSGQGVAIASGIAYQMSGANVIATVSVGSGLGTLATTSGQGFPAIGAMNRAINSGVTVVFASGTINIPSTDVNGNLVVFTSGLTAQMISGQALYVQMSGVNAQLSGIYIQGNLSATLSWVSTNMVSIGSGIAYQMSGANVIASVSVGSGLYIVMSGQGVAIASGIAYQMSGANVIATVSVGSGLGTLATTSGQGFPAIGAMNRAINSGVTVVFASGTINIPSTDVNGNLVVFTSGLTAQMISGQALYVQMSGVTSQMSGIFINATASSPVYVQSGNIVAAQPFGIGAFNTGKIAVGSSGTQFPSQACAQVWLTQYASNVLWLGGGSAANANSGVGFMWSTTGVDSRQTIMFNLTNLNLIWGKAQAFSSVIYYVCT